MSESPLLAGGAAVPGSWAQTWALVRWKTRAIWQYFGANFAWSRRLMFMLGLAVFTVAFAAMAMEAPGFVEKVLFSHATAVWAMSLFTLYFIATVFAGDLILGHTLNLGQMSHDQALLSVWPLRAVPVLLLRLWERVITDTIGIMMLLGGFIGLACAHGIDAFAVGRGVLMYCMVSSALGMGLINCITVLQRCLRPAALNNAFSLLSYLAAVFGMLPYAFFQANPVGTLMWVISHRDAVSGILDPVLYPLGLGIEWLMNPQWVGFAAPLGMWLGIMAVGSVAYLVFDAWHWTRWVHSGVRAPAKTSGRRWLRGFVAKEAWQLRHDMNLLTNAFLLPLTIIVFEIYLLKDLIGLSSFLRLINALAAGAMYFCLFGPMNTVGAEKKAIAFAETLPVSPYRFLWEKGLFWLVLAEVLFVPTSAVAAWYLGFAPGAIVQATVWMAVLTAAFVWVTVCSSAIFANYESKVLQQASTLGGKWMAVMFMAMFGPIRGLDPQSLVQLVVCVLLGISLTLKAAETLESRLDPAKIVVPRFRFADAFIAVLGMLALQGIISGTARALVPPEQVGLWPWLVAYLLTMTVLAGHTWWYTRERFAAPGAALGLRAAPAWAWVAALAGAWALAAGARWYLHWLDEGAGTVFGPSADVWAVAVEAVGVRGALALFVMTFCVVAPLVEELFFRGFLGGALRDVTWLSPATAVLANGALFALVHPWVSMPPVLLLGVGTAWLARRTGSIIPGIGAHAVYNAAVLAIHGAAIPAG